MAAPEPIKRIDRSDWVIETAASAPPDLLSPAPSIYTFEGQLQSRAAFLHGLKRNSKSARSPWTKWVSRFLFFLLVVFPLVSLTAGLGSSLF
jgi:hypothetical protein